MPTSGIVQKKMTFYKVRCNKPQTHVITCLIISLACSVFVNVFVRYRCYSLGYAYELMVIGEKEASQELSKVHGGMKIEETNNSWIYYGVLQSDFEQNEQNDKNDKIVTIVTQTTENHLHALVQLCEIWTGPVSVAVFVYGDDMYSALWKLIYYHLSYPKIKATTTFHLVIIKRLTVDIVVQLRKDKHRESTNFINSNIAGFQYPYNMLRNVALHSVKSGFVFMTDIDMLPSRDLHEKFLEYIEHSSNILKYQVAHIVPAFEIRNESFIPTDKIELLKLLKENNAHSYATMSCKSCQADTEFELWTKISQEKMRGYTIKRDSSSYEPFYILHRSVYPKFDERFVGRGKNRISQVCEVYMSGINFMVLTDAFMIHRGYRPKRSDYNKDNDMLYEKFKKDLRNKYHITDKVRKC